MSFLGDGFFTTSYSYWSERTEEIFERDRQRQKEDENKQKEQKASSEKTKKSS